MATKKNQKQKARKAKKKAAKKKAKAKKKVAKKSKGTSSKPKPKPAPDPQAQAQLERLLLIQEFANKIETSENETAIAEANYLKLKEATSAAKKNMESKVAILRAAIRQFREDSGPNLFNTKHVQPTESTPGAKEPVQYDGEAWRNVSIGELDIPDGAITKLAGIKKIATLGDLSEFMKRDELTDIKGIGPGAAQKIEDALQAWFAANADKCPPLQAATGDHEAEPPAPAPPVNAPKAGDPDYAGDGSNDPDAWKGIGIDVLRTRPKIGPNSITEGIAASLAGFEVLTLGHVAAAIADGSINDIKRVGPVAVEKILKAFTAFADQFPEYRESMVAASRDSKPASQAPGPDDGQAPETEGSQESDKAKGTAVIGTELAIAAIEYSAQELVDALISRTSGSCSTPFEIDGRLFVTLDYNEDETRIELCEVKTATEDTPTTAEILTDGLLSDNYEFLENSKLVVMV